MTGPKYILLIIIDTLRADHLGCYGYRRQTSPHLDHLATDSVFFTNAFSPSSYTLPSIASTLTAKYPSRHSIGFCQSFVTLDTDLDITLPEALSNLGYSTAAFVSTIVMRSETGIGAGFQVYDDEVDSAELNRPDVLLRDGRDTIDRALSWIESKKAANFFVMLHYMNVHGPYVCQAPFNELFVRDAHYAAEKRLERLVPDHLPFNGVPEYQALKLKRDAEGKVIDFEREVDYYIAQYDGCIRQCDDLLAGFFDKLKQLGIFEETLIIVTSDHGEAFGENGVYFFHGLTSTPDQIGVPLIVKPHAGWKLRPKRLNAHVTTMDLMPTLLSLCGYCCDDLGFDGVSLRQLIETGEDKAISQRTFLSEIERQYAQVKPDGTLVVRSRDVAGSPPNNRELVDTLDRKVFAWGKARNYGQGTSVPPGHGSI